MENGVGWGNGGSERGGCVLHTEAWEGQRVFEPMVLVSLLQSNLSCDNNHNSPSFQEFHCYHTLLHQISELVRNPSFESLQWIFND